MRLTAFLIFGMASFSDAFLTEFLLRSDRIAEGNPVMLSLVGVPGGMITVKTAVLVGIALLWKIASDNFLLAIAAGMTAVTFWNTFVLVNWFA
jgi:hypothetical protein